MSPGLPPSNLPPPAGGGFKSPPARGGIEGGVTDGLFTRPYTGLLFGVNYPMPLSTHATAVQLCLPILESHLLPVIVQQ
jgi:hypothetical protein